MTAAGLQIEDLSRLRMEPGDVLVIRSRVPLSECQTVALKEQIAAAGLPCKVLVVGPHLSFEILNHAALTAGAEGP